MKEANLTRILTGAVMLLALTSSINADTVNVEVRIEGPGVLYTDATPGAYAVAGYNYPVTITWSVQTDFLSDGATLGFVIHSPDSSISEIEWSGAPVTFGLWADSETWKLTGSVVFDDLLDGFLPDKLMTGGVTVGESGFESTTLSDFLSLSFTPSQASGSICIDSAFYPPAATFLMVGQGITSPSMLWDNSVGGYPDGGFCFTLSPCVIPGDLNFDTRINLADVTCLVSGIFGNGCGISIHPVLDQFDANGSGSVDFADVTY